VTEDPERAVRIERTFDARAEAVFDAWTDPEVLRRWFRCVPDRDTPRVEVDLRIGGSILIVMRGPDGTEARADGEFTVIDRPHRLGMIWTFDDDPSNQQLLELTFSESGGSTTVTLVNRRIAGDARRDAQHAGWHACLNQLERVLADPGPR
jgi:uncharacterized protein YndB with AHSA1/START domain